MNLALAYAAEVWVIVPKTESPNGADFKKALDGVFHLTQKAANDRLDMEDESTRRGLKVQASMLVPISTTPKKSQP